MSSIVLLICRLSLVLYSAGSGVKNVQVVLSELSMRLFEQACRSGCMCAIAVCMLLCVAAIVMSDVHILKTVEHHF